jgi:5-methyltetrahydropteroyltriglutamate--homocysteine methyltransferase
MVQAFTTTVIGSMPKPPWLYTPTIALDGKRDHFGTGGTWRLDGEALRQAQDDATLLAIREQENAGIDIVSDGEQRRKNYVTYLTRQMQGFDYETLAERTMRAGRRITRVGRCVGPIHHPGPILVEELRFLQAVTERAVKVTLPGPMTVVDSTYDAYYDDEKAMAFAWADAINAEAHLLDALEPAVIQFDEPVFSRYPEKTLAWGVAALDRCVAGLKAATAVHVCYGYPQPGLARPVIDSYPAIIEALADSQVQQLALEFEGARLSPALLRACPTKTVLFGCVFNSDEVMETPEYIASRLLEAAEVLSPEQIQAAPDCGLVTMTHDKAMVKLRRMVAGVALARQQAGFA